MKRMIIAAESTPQEDRLKEVLDDLSADFDYVVDGLQKLGREDNQSIDDAIAIAHDLETGINEAMQAIANCIRGGIDNAEQ